MMSHENLDADILVVGAGMAGLSAARALARRGLRVLVLEAQDRIGGRILTQRIGGEIIELGAEFVHGRPPELIALIEEAGLTLAERTGSWLREIDGALIPDSDEDESNASPDKALTHQQDDPFSLLEDLEDRPGPDLTFAEYLEQSTLDAEHRSTVINFVEGFNAADHRIIGIAALGMQQKAEDAIEGDRSFHVTGGYDQLPAFLAARFEGHGGELRIDTAVHRIEWRPNHVIAVTNQGSFSARRALITIPISVLQHGAITFDPPLSEPIRSLLTPSSPIRMGHALRFTLVFRERFWQSLPPQPALSELSFLVSSSTTPSVWWTSHPESSNTLTGWIGGPRTATLAGLSSEALANLACEALATLFHLDTSYIQDLLTGCFTHNWLADPHFYGAYSYIAKDGLTAPSLLATPIAQTLYFAGEHTTTDGHWGTVHAALTSGLRAAGQIAK